MAAGGRAKRRDGERKSARRGRRRGRRSCGRGAAGVSRLVTLVTERWFAEKRRRLVVRCSVIGENLSLSLSFSFHLFP